MSVTVEKGDGVNVDAVTVQSMYLPPPELGLPNMNGLTIPDSSLGYNYRPRREFECVDVVSRRGDK